MPRDPAARPDRLQLEVIGIPVSDVDAAKNFYAQVVGFNVDHDISPGPGSGSSSHPARLPLLGGHRGGHAAR